MLEDGEGPDQRDRETSGTAHLSGGGRAYLRLHRRTMSRLLRQRVVPGTKIGRQWRVRVADLDAVLAEGAIQQSSGGQPVVLVANDPPLAREAIARALHEVRPDIDTIAVDPAALAANIARYRPDAAICSERNVTVEATVPSWCSCPRTRTRQRSPASWAGGGRCAAELCRSGGLRRSDGPRGMITPDTDEFLSEAGLACAAASASVSRACPCWLMSIRTL